MNDLIPLLKGTLENYINELKFVEIELWKSLDICSNEIRDDASIIQISKQIPKHDSPVIYRIFVDSEEVRKALVDSYKNFHKVNKQGTRSLNRLNTSRFNDGESNTFYIGSSSKFKRRLEQHLGKGTIRTYALKINAWDSDMDYTLKVDVYSVTSKSEKGVSQALLELIEQEMWNTYEPVFGKKSGL